jgi:hypothetical protein
LTTINRTVARAFTAGVLALALCAGLSSPASAFLDKTRFLAHVGVAYYAFHHWVLTPYRNQQFASGRLKQGKFSPSDVESLDGAASAIGSTAAAAGSPIKDVPAAVPGL